MTACTRGAGPGRTAQAETVAFTIRRAGAQGAPASLSGQMTNRNWAWSMCARMCQIDENRQTLGLSKEGRSTKEQGTPSPSLHTPSSSLPAGGLMVASAYSLRGLL